MPWSDSVAGRGEVLALRRAVGFLPDARLDRFVIVQADRLTRISETVLVAPLDEALDLYASLPGALPVSAVEAGAKRRQVALLTQIVTLPVERFEPTAVGKLERPTRAKMDQVLRLVLDLP
jgi:mRNA-degrading endonuclease toxin of MazEF toxin-antitoxin module